MAATRSLVRSPGSLFAGGAVGATAAVPGGFRRCGADVVDY